MIAKMEMMSQVLKHPFQIVSAETGLVFANSLQPSEISSDDNPPGWAKRDEIWTIEELLGLYDSQKRKITIFKKGIEHVAQQLLVKSFYVEYVVRIHEWGHAGFHLGVDQNKSAELAKASLNNDKNTERAMCNKYRLDQLRHLERNQLQSRLRALIKLIRDGGVRGEQETWDTIMPW